MMEIVNGVVCFNCTDVDRAKKTGGEDPKAAKAGGAGGAFAASTSAKIDLDKLERSRVDESQKGRDVRNENRPLASGGRGTAFNILV